MITVTNKIFKYYVRLNTALLDEFCSFCKLIGLQPYSATLGNHGDSLLIMVKMSEEDTLAMKLAMPVLVMKSQF